MRSTFYCFCSPSSWNLDVVLMVLVVTLLPIVESLGSTSSWKPQQATAPHPLALALTERRRQSMLDWSSCCRTSSNRGRSRTTVILLVAVGTAADRSEDGQPGGEDDNKAAFSASPTSSSPSPPRGRRRVNETVRNIMGLLTTKYGSAPSASSSAHNNTTSNNTDCDWDKMRRYLYRATSSSSSTSKIKSRGLLTVQQVRKVLAYLDEELFPNHLDLQRSVLQTSPRILSRNVQTQLKPTVEFLQSLYQGSLFWEAVTRNPDLLLTTGTGYNSNDGGLDLVERYLRHDLQVLPAKLKQLQRNAPLLFQTSMTQLLSVMSFFQEVLAHPSDPNSDQETRSLSSSSSSLSTIRRLLESHPNLFYLSVTDNLRPRLEYLRKRCQLSDADVALLLHKKTSSAPAILGLSVRDNLQPTLDLLSQLISGDNNSSNKENNDNVRRTILQHPQILGLSLSNLRAKIAYFDSLDNHHHHNNNTETKNNSTRLATRILIRSPAVYSLSLRDNIVPTVEYLAEIWGIADATSATNDSNCTALGLATLLLEYPSILTLSLTRNLQPTVAFYQRAGYLPTTITTTGNMDTDGNNQSDEGQGQRTRLIIRGRYLASSLHHRLLPRWHFYQNHFFLANNNSNNAKGTEAAASASTTAPPVTNKQLPLHVLAGASDQDFCRHLGVELQHYIQFKDEAMPRLKFSSQFDTWLRTGVPMDT